MSFCHIQRKLISLKPSLQFTEITIYSLIKAESNRETDDKDWYHQCTQSQRNLGQPQEDEGKRAKA